MMGILTKLRTVVMVVGRGKIRKIVEEAGERFYSNSSSLILRRDLSIPLNAPAAKLPITVRPLHASDLARVVKERPRRYPVLRADIPTCYVAESNDAEICYMQWLIESRDQLRF